jgi:hypothetical protein
LFDLRDAGHPMARMNAPDDFVFLSRVQLAVASVFAGLGATEPITELGKLHHAWVRERLPRPTADLMPAHVPAG